MRMFSRHIRGKQSDFEIASKQLLARNFRAAKRQFTRAVEKDPALAAQAAEKLLRAGQSKSAIEVLRIPANLTAVSCPAPRPELEIFADAHRSLAHNPKDRRKFFPGHIEDEVSALQSILHQYPNDRGTLAKIAEGRAEIYMHAKYGCCLRSITDVKPSSNDPGYCPALFASFVESVTKCLRNCDPEALSLLDTVIQYGPSGDALKSASEAFSLTTRLEQFETSATSSKQAQRIRDILDVIWGRIGGG